MGLASLVVSSGYLMPQTCQTRERQEQQGPNWTYPSSSLLHHDPAGCYPTALQGMPELLKPIGRGGVRLKTKESRQTFRRHRNNKNNPGYLKEQWRGLERSHILACHLPSAGALWADGFGFRPSCAHKKLLDPGKGQVSTIR